MHTQKKNPDHNLITVIRKLDVNAAVDAEAAPAVFGETHLQQRLVAFLCTYGGLL